ncbi:MAG TPA: flagellin lysine-N-methylase, partial [Bryobacteraceae bacterium]|nr:flagellin lysine-N-methylase [Bryobacteraceae bacterium]
PLHFAQFRCLGADCEDTCCDGWAVTIDQPTYEKYRQCSDPDWRSRFQQLVTINQNPTAPDYARIRLAATTCPFLSEGLCSIHKTLGEEYLSVTCASFPRVWNAVDEVLEKSLDPGCPEAARRALLDPAPITFQEGSLGGADFSAARIAAIDSSSDSCSSKPYRHFAAVRAFIVWLLRNRALPLWKRLVILGFFCDKLQELGAAVTEAQVSELLQGYQAALAARLFDETLNQMRGDTGIRVEMLLELIVARITSDFTNRRFLACYKEFMDGLQWGPNSSMTDICARFEDAHSRYCVPFLSAHEHIFENYLVNYLYRNLFPFGPQETTYKLRDQTIDRSIHSEFMLLAAYYSMIDMLLGGMAGLRKETFGAAHVIQVVYTFTRTFEHSLTFPERVLQALDEKGLSNPAGAAVLLKS